MKKFSFLLFIVSFCLTQMISAQEVPQDVSTFAKSVYRLGPGDEVKAKVLGEQQFDFESVVDGNGNIEIPFFEQPVKALCKTEAEVKAEVVKLLTRYLRNPQVTFRVTDRKSRVPVIVSGEVRSPQNITLMRETRLLEVLSFVGGLTEDAGGSVEIVRPQAPICGVDTDVKEWVEAESQGGWRKTYTMSKIKEGGDSNPIVYSGDVVLIHKAAPIYITGEVGNPTGLRLQERGLFLLQALSMVGGPRREAKTKDIRIYRLKSGSNVYSQDREIISVNYDLIKKQQQPDVKLEPYDIIEVDKSKKSIAQIALEIATNTAKTAIGGLGSGIPTKILY